MLTHKEIKEKMLSNSEVQAEYDSLKRRVWFIWQIIKCKNECRAYSSGSGRAYGHTNTCDCKVGSR